MTNFKSLFVPFRYAPLHKERFKNRKPYLGFKIKCKFETGLRSKKCKLNSGQVTPLAAPYLICFYCLHTSAQLLRLVPFQPFAALRIPFSNTQLLHPTLRHSASHHAFPSLRSPCSINTRLVHTSILSHDSINAKAGTRKPSRSL